MFSFFNRPPPDDGLYERTMTDEELEKFKQSLKIPYPTLMLDVKNYQEKDINTILDNCNFAQDYKTMQNHPSFKNHPRFLSMLKQFNFESEFVSHLISDSYKRFGNSNDGCFLSDLLLKEQQTLDSYVSNIDGIVLIDNSTGVESVLTHKNCISDLMESYRVPRYHKSTLFDLFTLNLFHYHHWDYTIYIYTKDYLYFSNGYPSYYKPHLEYYDEGCHQSNVINRQIFTMIRRIPMSF